MPKTKEIDVKDLATLVFDLADRVEALEKTLINQGSSEEAEEAHAEYNEEEDAFECLIKGKARAKVCDEYYFDAPEIVQHLYEVHDLEPDEQIIDGWNDGYERDARSVLKKIAGRKVRAHRSKSRAKELPENMEEWNMGQLWSKARELGLSRKGNRKGLIRRIEKAMAEKSRKVPLSELKSLMPSLSLSKRLKITECPKSCPKYLVHDKCTPMNCNFL